MARKVSGILVKLRKQVIPRKYYLFFLKTSTEINHSNWILPEISGFSIFLKSTCTWSRHDGNWRDLTDGEKAASFHFRELTQQCKDGPSGLTAKIFEVITYRNTSTGKEKWSWKHKKMQQKKNERSGPRENGNFFLPRIRLSSWGSIGSLRKTWLWKQGLQTSCPPYLEFPAPAPLFVSLPL